MAMTDPNTAWRPFEPSRDALDAAAREDESRCAVCGWPNATSAKEGCVPGNCSQRPRPERLYAPERAKREAVRRGRPVCTTCNDTHSMSYCGTFVMCTRCPTPCQKCRSGGIGPYCDSTPCACDCHTRRA